MSKTNCALLELEGAFRKPWQYGGRILQVHDLRVKPPAAWTISYTVSGGALPIPTDYILLKPVVPFNTGLGLVPSTLNGHWDRSPSALVSWTGGLEL